MTVVRRKGRGVDGHARGIGYGLVGFATPRFNGSRQPVSSGAARHCQPVLKPGRPFLLVIVPRTALVSAVCLPGLGGCGRASRTSAVGGTREDARKRRGVEGHARSRRDGTGRDNPAQGILVREQQQAERPGTLIAPTQAGFESGRRFLAESP